MVIRPLEDYKVIGRVCKHSNVLSLPILIGRRLVRSLKDYWRWNHTEEYCAVVSVQSIFNHSGGNGEGVPPVLIPNTEVKPFSADGTWLDTAWESRSPPVTTKARRHIAARLSFFSRRSRSVTYAKYAPVALGLKKAKIPPLSDGYTKQ